MLLILGGISMIQAQENTYRGPMRIAGYEGEAVFQYRIVEDDTLRNGPFRIQKSDLQSLLQNEDTSFLFSGDFKDNTPEGAWKLRFGSFTSGNGSEVVDYQYRVLVNGVQEEASGLVSEGRPNGTWNILVNQIENSEITGTSFKSKIDFQNGVPKGSFQIEDTQSTLVGRFLRNGLAHDQWALYGGGDTEIEEDWYFKDGILERVETKNEGKITEWRLNYDEKADFKTVKLGEGYLQALRFQASSKDSLSFLKGSLPKLLVQNTSFYHKLDTIFTEIGTTAFYPEWKVKLPYYPLDSLEKAHLQNIRSQVSEAKSISDILLNSSQLNLLKLSDEEAAYGYAVVQTISEEWLQPLYTLLSYEDLGVLDYIQRSKLMADIWPTGTPSTTIDLQASLEDGATDRTFSLPNAEQFTWQGNDLQASSQVAQYALQGLQVIERQLGVKLGKQQSQQELLILEERLIRLNDSLQSYIDSVGNKLPKSHLKALRSVSALAEKQLSAYASVPETSEKPTMARELVGCFKELNRLGRAVGTLPQQSDSIQKRYVDGVWNPFVAVVMEEQLKKRITSAYQKVLVPYFLNQTQTSLSCETAADIQQRMEQTYRRMLALRDEDTKRLERKLRKEDDPETVLELFNLENPATEHE